jgi:ABC-2 type transport system permease protein
MNKKIFTVVVFAKLNTKRFFRDKLAIFFTILFPLIFLFVFGGIFGGDNAPSFKVAVINQSSSPFSAEYIETLKKTEFLEISTTDTAKEQAIEKMNKSQLDGVLVLGEDFGVVGNGGYPEGEAQLLYTQNNEQASRTLLAALTAVNQQINSQFVPIVTPITVAAVSTNSNSLTAFDYTFAGLLGFAIIGLGIFGPVNVFPELKKQGILRRLSTTPLRVWQYFVSTVASQTVIGLLTMAILFVVAITVFDLVVVGNIFALVFFLTISIMMILGIGLAIGGWAKNERQAAPLSNIIVFPMLFLSGTFFPRYIMPEWLQTISAYLPLTPVIEGIRLISTEGKTLIQVAPQIALIAVWGVVIYVIAIRIFRWE